jgi:hypothetical protein
MGEPIFHSHLTDELPQDHPLANEDVYCQTHRSLGCCDSSMLHAFNNECMRTWVEFADKTVCAESFAKFLLRGNGVLSDAAFVSFVSKYSDK